MDTTMIKTNPQLWMQERWMPQTTRSNNLVFNYYFIQLFHIHVGADFAWLWKTYDIDISVYCILYTRIYHSIAVPYIPSTICLHGWHEFLNATCSTMPYMCMYMYFTNISQISYKICSNNLSIVNFHYFMKNINVLVET